LIPYKEIIELVCPAELSQLTVSTGPMPANFNEKSFEMPRETKGAITSQMNSIGQAMLFTRQNYEQVLLKFSGGQNDINLLKLEQALSDMRISLNTTETRELRSFFTER